ncbi:hypothetical protein, partial [Streptomyces sp. SID3343]|uniref:hypothetical protein n=1 Tax=Streptomyces sp. SID3343 TaxID=2690260 RepID=UPI0013712123
MRAIARPRAASVAARTVTRQRLAGTSRRAAVRPRVAPFVVAGLAGLVVVSDHVADVPVAWVLFSALAGGPTWAAWAFGRRRGARRRTGVRAATALSRRAESAAEQAA